MRLDAAGVRLRLLQAYCEVAGVDTAVLDEPGISVAAEADRVGTGVASAYELGQHLVIRCDPAVVDRCRTLVAADVPPTLDGFESTLPPGTERLGRGFVHVVVSVEPSRHADVRVLDTTDEADRSLIAALIEADPDGAESAEIELEALDAHAVGVEVGGVLAAFVSERPWVEDPDFGDIGVLTHPDHRRRGLARSGLGELCARILADGRMPLYRCNATNVVSKALAERVGFVEAVRLSAAVL